MTYDEFVDAYFGFIDLALSTAKKARHYGLLELENDLDSEKVANREIFEYGMRFVVDGTDHNLIDMILSRVIAHEKDPYKSLLKTVEKEAVLAIQMGTNIRMTADLMSSFVDIPLSDPRYKKIFDDK
jgi:flagellar motor component MotA